MDALSQYLQFLGIQPRVKPRDRMVYMREYRRQNRARLNAYAAKWNKANRSKRRMIEQSWSDRNSAKRKVIQRKASKKWESNNPDKRASYNAARKAALLQRTPPWADHSAIRDFYSLALRLTEETGIPHEVDHVIPLQGETVSGLHVETNLTVLTQSENRSKGNSFSC